MLTTPRKTERIHSLDSLRAIMMLLGLVLHSAITFGIYSYGASWSIKDPLAQHISNDFITWLIHAFRMQTFFVVAGFFGALLFYERSPRKMMLNRLMRIVNPFFVFILILSPLVLFSFGYTRMIFNDEPNAFYTMLAEFKNPLKWLPPRTFHLWFLYYLGMITYASVLLAALLRKTPKLTSGISLAFNWLITKPILRIIVFGALTFGVYSIMGTSSVATSTSFIPDLNTFIYYSFFYLVGWILFKSKHLLDEFKRLDWVSLALGSALFCSYFFMYKSMHYQVLVVVKSLMVWSFIFGITGLFIRFGSIHSARMRYISDSSYWVYLVHLPLTAFIPGLIADWPLPATVKFLIVTAGTGVFCFLTYHYLVRGGVIGQFLNGRRYSRKLSDIRKAEELRQAKPVFEG